MNLFLISAAVVSLLALSLVFLGLPKKISSLNKLFCSVVSIIAITSLLITVADFSAIDRKNQFSEKINVELLKARQSPNNIVVWNDLGREYLLETEYVHAYMAFSQSEQLDSYVGLGIGEQEARSERLKWLTGLAEARTLVQDGGVDETANEFIQRSLKIDSQHPKALWYGGLSAAQRGNYKVAQHLWDQLMQQNPPEPLKTVVQNRLNSLTPLLETENSAQKTSDWELSFKLSISEEIIQSQTSNTKIFVSLRQNTQSPPVIAKSYDIEQVLMQRNNILSLTQADTIVGMSSGKEIDWEKSSELTIIWAQEGKVLDPDNERMVHTITQQNLDSIFEYTLK